MCYYQNNLLHSNKFKRFLLHSETVTFNCYIQYNLKTIKVFEYNIEKIKYNIDYAGV